MLLKRAVRRGDLGLFEAAMACVVVHPMMDKLDAENSTPRTPEEVVVTSQPRIGQALGRGAREGANRYFVCR